MQMCQATDTTGQTKIFIKCFPVLQLEVKSFNTKEMFLFLHICGMHLYWLSFATQCMKTVNQTLEYIYNDEGVEYKLTALKN